MATTRKNPPAKARRAVGIVRISTNRSDETSTTTQAERITAYCEAQGLELAEILYDTGRSAFKDSRKNRPGLKKAMDYINAGVDVLVCWKIDRVARNTRDLLELIHEIEQVGSSLASVTEQFDTATPIGRLVVTVIGALAEMESAIKSDRTQEWQDHRKAMGKTPTGARPFGYVQSRNKLTIHEDEAAIIRTAAAAVLDGESLNSLTKRLAAAGTRNTKTGSPFTRRGLARILTGPTIAGLREVDGGHTETDCWEPILDRKTWDGVREILNDPARRLGPGNERRWMMSGLMECGRPGCGAAMGAKPHAAGARYSCPKCHLSIAIADSEKVIARVVLELLDPDTWSRLRSRGSRSVDTTAIEEELATLARQRAVKEITPVEWTILRAQAIQDLADASAKPVRLPNVADPRKMWPDLDVQARRLIVAAVVTKCVVQPAKRGHSQFDESRVVIKMIAL